VRLNSPTSTQQTTEIIPLTREDPTRLPYQFGGFTGTRGEGGDLLKVILDIKVNTTKTGIKVLPMHNVSIGCKQKIKVIFLLRQKWKK
jgi:hypothetical protein